MNTARITLIVQLSCDGAPVIANVEGTPASVVLTPLDCTVVGTPKVEIDKHERCGMSAGQFYSALANMEKFGGSFARKLGGLLALADGDNREKLVDAFHDLIWGYVEVSQSECRE